MGKPLPRITLSLLNGEVEFMEGDFTFGFMVRNHCWLAWKSWPAKHPGQFFESVELAKFVLPGVKVLVGGTRLAKSCRACQVLIL